MALVVVVRALGNFRSEYAGIVLDVCLGYGRAAHEIILLFLCFVGGRWRLADVVKDRLLVEGRVPVVVSRTSTQRTTSPRLLPRCGEGLYCRSALVSSDKHPWVLQDIRDMPQPAVPVEPRFHDLTLGACAPPSMSPKGRAKGIYARRTA